MRRSGVKLPRNLIAAAREEGRDHWLVALPSIIGRLSSESSLTMKAPFQPGGQTAWGGPCCYREWRTAGAQGRLAHPEADHELDGLQLWTGNGAVEVHAVAEFDDTIVLLLERRLPGVLLSTEPEPRQDEVLTRLLRRLWIEPPRVSRLRPLHDMFDRCASRRGTRRPVMRAGRWPSHVPTVPFRA